MEFECNSPVDTLSEARLCNLTGKVKSLTQVFSRVYQAKVGDDCDNDDDNKESVHMLVRSLSTRADLLVALAGKAKPTP